MTPIPEDTNLSEISQADFQGLLQEKLRLAIRVTMITVLEEELEDYLEAARYQRTCRRKDERNGHYTHNGRE